MRNKQSCLALGVIVVSMTLPSSCWAKSDVDFRLERLENIIENQVSADLLNQLEAMQQEVQSLRGKIEEQQHEITTLNQKQEKLYLNLDSRIGSLTQHNGATPQSILPPDPVSEVHTTAPVLDPNAVSTTPAVTTGQIHRSDSIWHVTEYKEKEAYDTAYKFMSSKLYPEAITAFKEYLLQYPSGTYAPNSYYWLGEVYVLEWQKNKADQALIQTAISAFQTVVNNFPQHHKAVDSLLKLGIVEAEQQHWQAAKDIFTKVIQRYPDTSGARIADAKLQQLRQQGHI